MQLRDKSILLAGASSGIGRAVALELANSHNRLTLTARRESELEAVAEQVRARGSECLVVPADALDPEAAAAVVTRSCEHFGRVDAALLNIGYGPAQRTDACSSADITRVMRLNYDVFVHSFVPVVAQMKTQAGGGLIAHTNSLAGYLGLPSQGPYSAAKAAVRIFMDTARVELAPHGIRAITICPGFVAAGSGDDAGVPRPFELSAEAAASHIVRAMTREQAQTDFPLPTSLAVGLARALPRPLRERALAILFGG